MSERHQQIMGSVNFGTTTVADGVPDVREAYAGPAFLEGRLVLAQSFRACAHVQSVDAGEPLEVYRVWDDEARAWHPCGLELQRFEHADVVLRDGRPVWEGALDVRVRIISRPDLDAPDPYDLCWQRV